MSMTRIKMKREYVYCTEFQLQVLDIYERNSVLAASRGENSIVHALRVEQVLLSWERYIEQNTRKLV
jgi:hypothetical protein